MSKAKNVEVGSIESIADSLAPLEPTPSRARTKLQERALERRRKRQLAVVDGFSKTGQLIRTLTELKVDRRTHYPWLRQDPWYAARFEKAREAVADSIKKSTARSVRADINGPVNPLTLEIGSIPVGGECRFPCGCLVRVVEHVPPVRAGGGFGSIVTMGHAKIEYVDLCELCETRHQVGDTLNTEHGWIPVERIDDFHELLIDNFAPEASPHRRLRRPRRIRGTCESTRQP